MTEMNHGIPDGESLGSYLRKLRNRRDLSQRELGERIGVSGVTVGYWEQDCYLPCRDNWRRLREWLVDAANALADPPDGLFDLGLGERVAFTLDYQTDAGRDTLRFTGRVFDVVPTDRTDFHVHDGTAVYLLSDHDRSNDVVIVADETGIHAVEIGPDGNRTPVTALQFRHFRRLDDAQALIPRETGPRGLPSPVAHPAGIQ